MKYLGVDFGLRRLGLAISEGIFASSLDTIEVRGLKDAIDKVSKLAKDQEFTIIIVGLPEGKIGKTVLRFVNALKKEGFNVETADETLSTRQAERQMINLGMGQKKRRLKDAQAAAIILQNYLDSL